MNKKIILSLFILFCLLTSINFALAYDNGSGDASAGAVDEKMGSAPTTNVYSGSPKASSPSVAAAPSDEIKIDLEVFWKGGSAPDFVEVNILKDGSIVKTVALSKDNDWKATVELPMYDDDGSEITYEVKEVTPNGFEASYKGDQKTGFTITNIPSKLGAPSSTETVGDDEPTPNLSDDVPVNDDDGSNDTGDNQTEGTDAPITDATGNGNDTDSSSKDTGDTQPVNKTVKVVKKVVKAQDKKDEPKRTPPTGNPIAILVLVLIGTVFVSMRGRKD